MITQLVARARGNDQDAWNELYSQTCKGAYFVALKVCGKEQDALDLVQDAYLTAYTQLEQLQDPTKFQPWLNMIVANKCRDYLKKKRPTLFSELGNEDDPQPEWEDDREYNLPEQHLDREETSRIVAELINALPEEQRLCVLLYYQEEMSVSEIAQALQVSDGTVKSRLNYARKKVADKVRELEKKGTKLYGLSPIPFFIWLLRGEAEATSAPAAIAATTSALSSSATVAAAASKTAAGAGVKGILSGIGAKVVAGIAAAAIVLGGGVIVSNQTAPNEPDTPHAPVSSPTASPVSTPSTSELALQTYEALLRAGVTDSGMKIKYYAHLDLDQDNISELLVADDAGGVDNWTTGELYTFTNDALFFIGQTDARYDYFYLVNNSYLLGTNRMGHQFLSPTETLITSIYHWNEEKTRNDPAIWRNGGDYEYITQEEFKYYNLMPGEEEAQGKEIFIKEANAINLLPNPFFKISILEKSLDYQKAWEIIEPIEGSSSSYSAIMVFQPSGLFYCVAGYRQSDVFWCYSGTYAAQGDTLLIDMELKSGSSSTITYTVEAIEDGVRLIQTSEEGIFKHHISGDTFEVYEYEWGDAREVISKFF